MKNTLLLFSFLCFSLILQAQVIKTANISSCSLSYAINKTGKYNTTHLTLKGTIDARDFRIMRDSLPHLIVVDLSGSRIVAYSTKGHEGTNISITMNWNTGIQRDSMVSDCDGGYNFANNEIPIFAFRANKELVSIVLPLGATAISDEDFMECSNLASITIPENISIIGDRAFSECSSLKTILIRSAIPVDLNGKTDLFNGVNKKGCTLLCLLDQKENTRLLPVGKISRKLWKGSKQ